MTDFTFTIPLNRSDLLQASSDYTVNLVPPNELTAKLKECKELYREQGPSFILETFDTFFSVIHQVGKIRPDLIDSAYDQLQRAAKNLRDHIYFLLKEKDSLNEEVCIKTTNTLKMLLYIYIEFIFYLEEKTRKSQDDITKNKKEKKITSYALNRSEAINAINNIIQLEINLFWQPPIVEHNFVSLIGGLCFVFLQNSSIQKEKNTLMDIFGLFGNLIKSYDYGETFVIRMVTTIRMYVHVAHSVAEGIKLLVEQFKCSKLVHHFVKEATEWEVDETSKDNQGEKNCAAFLSELVKTLPDSMFSEVAYLNRYLAHESIPLRTAVLNIMNEIVLQVLTKQELSEDDKELRDEILEDMLEHLNDVSAVVRTAVLRNIIKLEKENALPLHFKHEVLMKIFKHLYDKAAAVRKFAINCVTVFLEYNLFGSNLQLKRAEEQLNEKKGLLDKMEACYKEAHLNKIKQLEDEWLEICGDIRTVFKLEMTRIEDDDIDDLEFDKDEAVEKLRTCLNEKKYIEAFQLCRMLKESTTEFKKLKQVTNYEEIELYMSIVHSVFVNEARILEEFRTKAEMTDTDLKKIEAIETNIKYFESTIEFLKIMETAMGPMKSLLFSESFSDTQEAIQFFVCAYRFQLDNSNQGILEMLRIMRCSEQERQNAVIDAFKTMYLMTDAKNMSEHTSIILNRLIYLLKDLKFDDLEDFENIVKEWTAKGMLDNNVIDKCWQYYTQRENVSNDDACAAGEILRMAALGRSTIIRKNIYVVSTMIFSEKHRDDMVFLATSCRLLATAGCEKIDSQSQDSPFKINFTDSIFKDLSEILIKNFFENKSFYSEAMQAALLFIFKVCSRPTVIVEKILSQVTSKLTTSPKTEFLVIRFCELLGYTAIQLLGYLDNSVYREIKRRSYLRKESKKEKVEKQKQNDNNSDASFNESILLGAEAEDADAEFILSTLENDVVSKKGLLGQNASFLLKICQKPDLYPNLILQQAAVTALMRFMLISSKFCSENIRLIFTILQKTQNSELKCTVLIQCADLLARFPNIIEPWSSRIYGMLKDEQVEVRKKAFFVLANLILKGMIRAHSHISEMANCLIDEDETIRGMCKSFFERMEQKDNNIVNVIPDIFTHLIRDEGISEENVQEIMKFLFDIIDGTKRMENLVDRFCSKFTPDENGRLNQNIAFCLSLVNYNDKALRKLHEKFPNYQHHLHDKVIYSTLKKILAECSKTKAGKADLKPIVKDIEDCIASVFEVNDNGETVKTPPVNKTKSKNSRAGRKKARKQNSWNDEDDSEEEVIVKKTGRKKIRT